MTPFLPQVTAKDVARVAKKTGFLLDRQKGSHAVFVRPADKARVVIPMHTGRDIRTKTLYAIIDDLRISPEEFKRLL